MGNELFNVCDRCGKKDNISRGIMHNTFSGYAGYGSRHDGKYITLCFCSDCLDQMLSDRMRREKIDSRG